MLTRMILVEYHGQPGSWMTDTVARLAAYHEDLASRFDAILRKRKFRILSYYQEPSPSDEYELVG